MTNAQCTSLDWADASRMVLTIVWTVIGGIGFFFAIQLIEP